MKIRFWLLGGASLYPLLTPPRNDRPPILENIQTTTIRTFSQWHHARTPPEPPLHKIGATVTLDGRQYKIIGCSGHSQETLKTDMTQRELFTGPFAVACRYAKINARQGSRAVGYFGVPTENEHLLRLGPAKCECIHNPWTPESMQKAGVQMVAIQPVSDSNDPSLGAAIRRFRNAGQGVEKGAGA